MQFAHTMPLSQAADLPPAIALYGVYTNGKLVYIGTSTCLRRRFKLHISKEKFESNSVIKWNEYQDNQGEKMNSDEREAISELKPPLNKIKQGAPRVRKTWNTSLYGKKARDRSVLHQATYDLLWAKIESSISKLHVLDTLAKQTGLSYSWLEKFAQDNGGSPAVERLELLYVNLSGNQLKIEKKA